MIWTLVEDEHLFASHIDSFHLGYRVDSLFTAAFYQEL